MPLMVNISGYDFGASSRNNFWSSKLFLILLKKLTFHTPLHSCSITCEPYHPVTIRGHNSQLLFAITVEQQLFQLQFPIQTSTGSLCIAFFGQPSAQPPSKFIFIMHFGKFLHIRFVGRPGNNCVKGDLLLLPPYYAWILKGNVKCKAECPTGGLLGQLLHLFAVLLSQS